MFKVLILALTVVAGGSAAANTALPLIPQGSYSGKANWRSVDGQSARYTVSATVKDGTITSIASHSNRQDTYAITTKATSNGFFDVYINGDKVGLGYCLSVQCNYSVKVGSMVLEESLTFWHGQLYRVGTKRGPGYQIAWEEALQKGN